MKKFLFVILAMCSISVFASDNTTLENSTVVFVSPIGVESEPDFVESLDKDKFAYIYNGKVYNKSASPITILTPSEEIKIGGLDGGRGIYKVNENGSFLYIEPQKHDGGIYDASYMKTIPKDVIKKDGIEWRVFFVCRSTKTDSECRQGVFGSPGLVKVASGDIYKLKR